MVFSIHRAIARAFARTSICAAVLGGFAFASEARAAATNRYFVGTVHTTYTGTVTPYATLSDATNQINPTAAAGTTPNRLPTYNGGTPTPAAFITPYRDLGLWLAHGLPAAYTGINDATYFYSNWSGPGPVADNPNNGNPGFIQYYDDPATFDTVNSAFFGAPVGATYTEMTVHVAGANAVNGTTRSWLGDAGSAPYVTFLSWDLNVTFSGLSGTVVDPSLGLVEADNEPTSALGTFTGIFEYDPPSLPAEFYRFDYAVSLDNNWMFGDPANAAYVATPAIASAFVAILPEPGTLSAFALTASIALLKRRSSRVRI